MKSTNKKLKVSIEGEGEILTPSPSRLKSNMN